MVASRFFRASLLDFSKALRQCRRMLFGGRCPAPLCVYPPLCFERDPRFLEFPSDALQFVQLDRRFLAPRRACLALGSERSAHLIEYSFDRGNPREALAHLCRGGFCA